MEVFPATSGSIPVAKLHETAAIWFGNDHLLTIQSFVREWGNADHEFLDRTIEKKRSAFYAAVRAYAEFLARSFVWSSADNMHNYPPDLLGPDKDRRTQADAKLFRYAIAVSKTYDDLVRTAKRRLEL